MFSGGCKKSVYLGVKRASMYEDNVNTWKCSALKREKGLLF